VAWYITLVTNTNVYPEAPTSWAALWDPANKDKLGLLALVSNSFLLEVTAKTFLGGTQALDSEEGISRPSRSSPRSSRMSGCGTATRPSSSRR
jgi:putative spermidine/putrescine transport system substrate-binding protein